MKNIRPLIAVWFSCGAASAVASKKTIEKYSDTHDILIVNNPVIEEHPDNLRFLKDVELWLGKSIILAGNSDFPTNSAYDVWEKRRYMSGVKGAPCTVQLKKEARYRFEKSNNIDFHVLGFTYDEKHRHDRFVKYERENVIPVLIDEQITKQDCFNILKDAGIALPIIYSLGYPNANCIGCVKSSSPTYWNLVRNTFPEVFNQRAEQSRRIGCKLVKVNSKTIAFTDSKNKYVRIYLDELSPTAKGGKIKSHECGIFCELPKLKPTNQ